MVVWAASSVTLGFLLSFLSALTVQNYDCGSISFSGWPCGLLAGWPVGFAEFELDGETIIVDTDGLLPALPPLQGIGYHYGEFHLSLFAINTVLWVILAGAAALIFSAVRALRRHITKRQTDLR